MINAPSVTALTNAGRFPSRPLALALLALLSPLGCTSGRGASSGDSSPTAAALPAAQQIRGEAISARIRFLSDDRLEGRFTGSRGHAIAERYVASEFQAMGLAPAGENGGYLQPVPLRSALKDFAHSELVLGGGKTPGDGTTAAGTNAAGASAAGTSAAGTSAAGDEAFKVEQDFVLGSDLRTADVDVAAPLVFVGYDVIAPEYHYDDLAGVDVKGKIAVCFSGAPLSEREDFFPPIAHAVLGDGRAKVKRLAERGAVGLLTIFRPEDEERLPWARVALSSRLPQMSWLKNGQPGASPAGVPLRGSIHWKAFERVLSRAGFEGGLAALEAKAKANALKPFDLPVTLHGKLHTDFHELTSGNVAGVLRGSDPKLRDEYVVYSAHLDHLGIGAPIDGDPLYNGALDNASGVASVLEIARAFTALKTPPARSILFLTVTGEERGLLGSEYFARNPTVPAGSIAADINIDMIVALAKVFDVFALGVEHSTLSRDVRAALDALHLTLSPDPRPKQMSFIRSDQYSFVRQGVPSVNIGPGELDAGGRHETYAERRKQWIATRYHSPKDKWDPSYDYESMAQIARADFLVGLSVAQRQERPRWNEGDFFARYPEKE